MQYDAILICLGELFLKGKNKYRFIDKLLHTVQTRLSIFPELTIKKSNDHFLVLLHGTDYEAVLGQLDFVFGIHSYALGKVCDTSIEAIQETALPVAVEACRDGHSIKLETKRGWKPFPFNSIEVSQQVAKYVGDQAPEGSILFNVANPDRIVSIFIKRRHTLVVGQVVPASGGLPIGLNGRSLLMLSGGIDSPVAGYLMMKRGMALEGIYFESPPHTTIRARQKVYDLAEKLAHYMPNGRMLIHVVAFTRLQQEIFEHIRESYGMTVMRRMMYRITAGVAEKRRIRMLANGECLGQVASQTPDSIWTINAVTDLPVIRPAACMDKVDIMALARKIGTYDISIRPYEDCCTVFLPKYPSICPKKEKCERYEEYFDWQPLVQDCIDNAEEVEIIAGRPIALDGETTDRIGSLL